MWHYSGKCGLQPWMFIDNFDEQPHSTVVWLDEYYGTHGPGGVVAAASGFHRNWLLQLASSKLVGATGFVYSGLLQGIVCIDRSLWHMNQPSIRKVQFKDT